MATDALPMNGSAQPKPALFSGCMTGGTLGFHAILPDISPIFICMMAVGAVSQFHVPVMVKKHARTFMRCERWISQKQRFGQGDRPSVENDQAHDEKKDKGQDCAHHAFVFKKMRKKDLFKRKSMHG